MIFYFPVLLLLDKSKYQDNLKGVLAVYCNELQPQGLEYCMRYSISSANLAVQEFWHPSRELPEITLLQIASQLSSMNQ